jgi:hypothetical protein
MLTMGVARGEGPANAEEGRRAFAAGVILLQDPDGPKFDEAIVQFHRAYEMVGSWKILGNLGLCALKLERDGEAIEAYEKYLEGGKNEILPDERVQVERDLVALRAQVSPIMLQLPPGGGSIVDERSDARGTKIINRYTATTSEIRLGLHPGAHLITVRNVAGQAKWEAALEPGRSVTHRFEVDVAPPPSPISPLPAAQSHSSTNATIGYVVGGLGVAGIGVGSVFGLTALSKKRARDEVCSNGTCTDPKGPELDDQARRAATISTIGMGVGLAGVGVGAWLLLSKSMSPPATAAQRVWVAPEFSASAAQVTVGGAL